MDQPVTAVDVRPLLTRLNTESGFRELVAAMATSIEAGRFSLADMQDAVTLLKHGKVTVSPIIITSPVVPRV
jgi:hypothetical protein